mmetsp:Transcript_17857/g.40590  ORF Transcript_17857/g.40590 Transcript_17857/m.40590 type:complete len:677 (-) Transcript_17857:366-2396(-)
MRNPITRHESPFPSSSPFHDGSRPDGMSPLTPAFKGPYRPRARTSSDSPFRNERRISSYSPNPLAASTTSGSFDLQPRSSWRADLVEDSASETSSVTSYFDNSTTAGACTNRRFLVSPHQFESISVNSNSCGSNSSSTFRTNHHTTSRRPNATYTQTDFHNQTRRGLNSNSEDSLNTSLQKNLAHGLTVGELKEMTKARLSREADCTKQVVPPTSQTCEKNAHLVRAPFLNDSVANRENICGQTFVGYRNHNIQGQTVNSSENSKFQGFTNQSAPHMHVSNNFPVYSSSNSRGNANYSDFPSADKPFAKPENLRNSKYERSTESPNLFESSVETNPPTGQGPLGIMKSFMPSIFDYSFRPKVHPMNVPTKGSASPPGLSRRGQFEAESNSFFSSMNSPEKSPAEPYAFYKSYPPSEEPAPIVSLSNSASSDLQTRSLRGGSSIPVQPQNMLAQVKENSSFFSSFRNLTINAGNVNENHNQKINHDLIEAPQIPHRRGSSELPNWVAESVLAPSEFSDEEPIKEMNTSNDETVGTCNTSNRQRHVFRRTSLNKEYTDEIPGLAITENCLGSLSSLESSTGACSVSNLPPGFRRDHEGDFVKLSLAPQDSAVPQLFHENVSEEQTSKIKIPQEAGKVNVINLEEKQVYRNVVSPVKKRGFSVRDKKKKDRKRREKNYN